MVYIYLPVAYYHLNLDVTKENLLAAGFSAVPAVFLVYIVQTYVKRYHWWQVLKWKEISKWNDHCISQ